MIKSLCINSLFFGMLFSVTSVWAENPKEHYRTLHVQAELTKQTKSFQVKHLFPFHFPNDLPGKPVFKGVTGQFSTTTQAKLDKDDKDITFSETLFAVDYASNNCPKVGEAVSSYQDLANKYTRYSLVQNIVKQTKGNSTQVSDVDYILPKDIGISVNTGDEGCGIVVFDGTDFTGNPYTMKVDLQLKYTFEPITKGLDGEFVIGAYNIKNPTLNAYIVLPVKSGSGKGYGVLRPGIIYAVNGNVATSAVSIHNKGNWFVRYITAVYKKNSCQIAFKNHRPTKFQWNDKTGTGNNPNPSSVFWPDVTIISDFTSAGKDRDSVMAQANGNKKLPIHVEDGDCVVQVALPYGDRTTGSGSNMNMESQVYIRTVPD